MLFICYFEIMPEKITEVTKGTLRHSERRRRTGRRLKVILRGRLPPTGRHRRFGRRRQFGAVFRYIRPWCGVNGKILVEPALRVDDGEFAKKFPRDILE